VQRIGSFQGVPHFGCLLNIEAEHRMKVNDPLYGQTELDSAVAAERERCASAVRALEDGPDCGDADGYMRALRDALQAIG